MPAWSDVVRLASALDGVEEGTSYRTPALRTRKKLICRLKEDGESLMVRVVDLEDKAALLREHPDVLFTTGHYDDHASVLVRLPDVDESLLSELIEDAWKLARPGSAP